MKQQRTHPGRASPLFAHLPVGNDLHRQCISCLCQPAKKPHSGVFNFDNDMQQVRRMTPFYNSGLCMSTLSCDQVFIALKLLDYKSNQARFCLFFLAENKNRFSEALFD